MSGPIKSEGAEYKASANFVNVLLGVFSAALLGVVGYMVLWALHDAEVKAELRAEADFQSKEISLIRGTVAELHTIMLNHMDGHPDRVEDQIESLNQRIDRLEK